MGRFSALLASAAVALILGTTPLLSAQNSQPKFTPPDLDTAGDIDYPVKSVASGVVVVAVYLDGAGMIKRTEVLRDIPSLTAPVLLAIKTWTFKPAMLDGKGVDSTAVVSIVFNPSDYRLGGASAPILGKELRVLVPDSVGFLPPKIIAASWAGYPLNSVAKGAVILDAHVGPTGRVTHVTTVWEIEPLTGPSIRAAKNWTFKPATFKGASVSANAVVGYVFRLPNISNPVANP
jgi:hypothetical protein